MKELEIWTFLAERLQLGESMALLVVVESLGSSPGRCGFKMAVAADGEMNGSIGGGIMEHKLVEWAKDRLQKGIAFWELKRQIHSKEAPQDQSGMICSGEQTIALLCLSIAQLPAIRQGLDALKFRRPSTLTISATDIQIESQPFKGSIATFQQSSHEVWGYREMIGSKPIAHVIGAGHVGLAMCKVLSMMDFYVVNYDDRPDLNTMRSNAFADQKIVVPYPQLGQEIAGGADQYLIVMTFGYRGDDEAIRALLGKQFAYIGMMGSTSKVAKLLAGLRRDGFSEASIQQMHCPAGLVNHCKTPIEIAISIAAEIMQVQHSLDIHSSN